MGDATNAVIIIAGELLKKAEHLLIMGLHPSEITRGYELALKKGLEELESTFTHLAHILILDLRLCSTFQFISTYTVDPRDTLNRPETRHRIKTVWI